MLNQQESMEGMKKPNIVEKYTVPNVEDIKSWDLKKLEEEFEKLEAERKRLIATARSTPNRIGEAKKLANIGRQIFEEIEKGKRAVSN